MTDRASPQGLLFRPFRNPDAVTVTDLLHRAYGQLMRMGLRYWATHQSVDDTIWRAARGDCTVAERGDVIVGTIVLMPPETAGVVAWYDRPCVATFGQFAVEPELQGAGLGSALLEQVETRALEIGAKELACDTSDHATHLIAWYVRRGYRLIGHVDHRPHTNYCSVILSKAL